jgi:hypothetical protein
MDPRTFPMQADSPEYLKNVEADETDVVTPEVVPPAEVTRARQVWPRDDAKILTRLIKIGIARGVGFVPICAFCTKEQRNSTCAYGRLDATGEIVMQCQCSVRILEGTR